MPARPHVSPSAPFRSSLRAALIGVAALLVARSASAGRYLDPAAALRPSGYSYLSPLPGSRFHPVETSIAIRPEEALDRAAALDPGRWSVTGDRSGVHDGSLAVASDGRTLIFRPARPFAPGERVHVVVRVGLRTRSGAALPGLDWSFQVRDGEDGFLRSLALSTAREHPEEGDPEPSPSALQHLPADPDPPPTPLVMPRNYFPVAVSASSDPDTVGGIFLSPFSVFSAAPGRLLVVDHRGEPLFFRSLPQFALDFRRQPNGLLTYWNRGMYFGLDSTYTVVDSFGCGNGYLADDHEMQLLPNGHALLIAYDPEPYPMDTVVAGGRPDAIVTGLVIQEIDESKNVVFQWRSWDHFLVTDLVECAAHLTDANVDYVHGNALEEDTDGNILLSSRHLDEITKIDRATGDVLWRMGPHAKHNQFTFYDDQTGFSHQHDVRRLPNGHLTVFDNGNCVSPHSRTVEYQVDEVHQTAEFVREYVHTSPLSAPFMGNCQQHSDGSVTIGWGGSSADPKVTELHPDGSVALELALGSGNHWSYRALRFPWETTAFTTAEQLEFGDVDLGTETTRSLTVVNHMAAPLTLNQFVSSDSAFAVVSPDSLVLDPGASGTLLVRFRPAHLLGTHGDLYVRAVDDTQLVARVVHLSGVGAGSGVTIGDVALAEGALGDTTAFAFTVKVSPPASGPVTVDYATSDSTAFAWQGQYLPASGTLVIPAGDSTAQVVVRVIGDNHAQFNRIFRIQLSHLVGAAFIRDVAYGTILNDDGLVGVGEDAITALTLHAPVPNPARQSAEIGFDLPRPCVVSLEVFDVRGRRVADLMEGVQSPGRRSSRWSLRGRPAGMYFVRLRAGGETLTRSLTIVR